MQLKKLMGSGDKVMLFTAPFLVVGLILNIAFPLVFSVGGPSATLRTISILVLIPGVTAAHAIVTMALVVLMLLFIGLESGADGRWFRIHTILTIVAVIVGGVLSGLQGSRLTANEPTPWLGVTERANIFLTLLWVGVFAVVLLQRNLSESRKAETTR